MAADGKVVIEADLDSKKAQAQLNRLAKKIEDLDGKISQKKSEQSGIGDKLKAAQAEADKTQARIEELKAAIAETQRITGTGTTEGIGDPAQYLEALDQQQKLQDELKEAQDLLKQQTAEAGKLAKQYETASNAVADLEGKQRAATQEAAELSAQLADAGDEGAGAGDKAANAMESLGKKLTKIARKLMVFTLLKNALKSCGRYMMDMIKQNDEAAAAIGNLRGALMTLAQPILNVIIPAFIALINVITKVVAAIASLVSRLFGSNLGASKQQAKNLYDEQKALEGVGGAAKDASKQLAAFDEINKLEDNSGGGGGGGGGGVGEIVPTFDFSYTEDELNNILRIVELIGAAILAWKIGTALGGGLQMISGLFLAILGVIVLIEGYLDAWKNGIDLKNMIKIIAGLTAVVVGLYIAFGSVAAGIALVVGGAALIVLAFKDIMDNGLNLHNVLVLIAGLLAAGLGISLLVGNFIPLLIAGILAVIVAVTAIGGTFDQVFGGLRQILDGFIKFFKGVFAGDIDMTMQGICDIIIGVLNVVLGIFGGVVNTIIKGLNWLIGKMNSISFDVPAWVPAIGGKTLGVNIPLIPEWSVPKLAQGAVIPPNKEFMAVLGDQKSGTNIEAPLDVIVQAVRQALNDQRKQTIILELDRRELGRAVVDVAALESGRVGIRLGGV